MKILYKISLFLIILFLISCNKIKDKTKNYYQNTKQKIENKKSDLIDYVYPVYDRYDADTYNNKKRFKEHLKVELTKDVKNIFCYADFLGIDYTVLISFECDSSTIEKIVKAKDLKLADFDLGLSLNEKPFWWKDELFEKIKPYKKGEEFKYWEILWYDKNTKTAYYQEFSM